MRKFLIRLLVRLLMPELTNKVIDEDKRAQGYEDLYTNVNMMHTLDKILVEDTKAMMKSDSFKGDFVRGARYGMFIRTKAIQSKAKFHYEQRSKKPNQAN